MTALDPVTIREATDDPQTAIVCGTCAVAFTIPEPLRWRHERTGKSVWCPNGHLLGSDFQEPVTLALQRAQDLASELGTELALERIDHLRTRAEHRDALHGLLFGRCPVDGCSYVSKTFGNHFTRHHPDADR